MVGEKTLDKKMNIRRKVKKRSEKAKKKGGGRKERREKRGERERVRLQKKGGLTSRLNVKRLRVGPGVKGGGEREE